MEKRIDKKNAINSFDEVNEALKQVALNDAVIEEQTALMNQQLLSVKEQYEPDVKNKIKENKQLEKDIEKFLKSNKSLFEKVRSKILTFGKVGFQLGKRCLGKPKTTTWEVITEQFFEQFGATYVVVKKKLNKTAVITALDKGKLSIKQIESTGAVVSQVERAFYKPFKDKIQDNNN